MHNGPYLSPTRKSLRSSETFARFSPSAAAAMSATSGRQLAGRLSQTPALGDCRQRFQDRASKSALTFDFGTGTNAQLWSQSLPLSKCSVGCLTKAWLNRLKLTLLHPELLGSTHSMRHQQSYRRQGRAFGRLFQQLTLSEADRTRQRFSLHGPHCLENGRAYPRK